jgi:Ca2+-binding EF-hand superfamily protein
MSSFASLNMSEQDLGNFAKKGGSEALRNLIDVGKRMSSSTMKTRRVSNMESTNERGVIYGQHRHKVPGHTANEETTETPVFTKPQIRLQQSIIAHNECASDERAGLKTKYGERQIGSRKFNSSVRMNSIFEASSEEKQPKVSEKMLQKRKEDNSVASQRSILHKLRLSGGDTREVFIKNFKRSEDGEVSIRNFIEGLGKFGANLNSVDAERLADAVDPEDRGFVSYAAFARVLDENQLAPKLKNNAPQQRRASHLRENIPQIERMKANRVMSNLDKKLNDRFGTGTNRLRRLYMSLERNGDGTVTPAKLRQGMERLGISLNDKDFRTFLKQAKSSGENDVYYTDLLHAFEVPEPQHRSSEKGKMRINVVPPKIRKNWDTLDLSDRAYTNEASAEENEVHHSMKGHIPHLQHDVDTMNLADKIQRKRPKQMSEIERKTKEVKRLILNKLYERGKSTTTAFLELDSDRDGIVTKEDIRLGMMHRLGLPLREDQVEILASSLGTGASGEGSMIQEFVAAFDDIDGIHGYTNDIRGSGGGGDLEGPVACAVGPEVVQRWGGSREHRGQLSCSLTAKGTHEMGPQYSSTGIGQVGLTARQAAAAKAALSAPSKEDRRRRVLIANFSEKISHKREDLHNTFVKMDVDRHGSLSYREFRQGLDNAGVHLSDTDFLIVAKEIDPLGDGRINFVDFARAIKCDQRDPLDLSTSPQKTAVAARDDGSPVRVGLCSTDTPRNHSDEIHSLLRMPAVVNSDKNLRRTVGAETGRVSTASNETIEMVAARLKISDTLSSKCGPTLREQYMDLERHGGSNLNAGTFFKALRSKGIDISRPELIKLFEASGVEIDQANVEKTKVGFDDFKRISYSRGLGEDSREYDFLRAIQNTPGVGVAAGSIDHKQHAPRGSWEVGNYVTKHLTEAAGASQEAQYKRNVRDKNIESGVGEMLTEPTRLHVDSDTLANYDIHERNYTVNSRFQRPALYKEHDQIRAKKLLGGWENSKNLDGYKTEESRSDERTPSRNQKRTPSSERRGGRETMLTANLSSERPSRILRFKEAPPPSPAAPYGSLGTKTRSKSNIAKAIPRSSSSGPRSHSKRSTEHSWKLSYDGELESMHGMHKHRVAGSSANQETKERFKRNGQEYLHPNSPGERVHFSKSQKSARQTESNIFANLDYPSNNHVSKHRQLDHFHESGGPRHLEHQSHFNDTQ